MDKETEHPGYLGNQTQGSSSKSNNVSNREASIYSKPSSFDPTIFSSTSTLAPEGYDNNARKGSTSSTGSGSGGTSFTQRLLDRGVAVPSSFSNWDHVRQSADENTSSPGSFDFDSYYGMSPFITPSFSAVTDSNNFSYNPAQDGKLYKSLRHRYEREKGSANSFGSTSSNLKVSSEDEDISSLTGGDGGLLSSPDYIKTSSSSSSSGAFLPEKRSKHKGRAEDSDIELSDEEVEEEEENAARSNCSTPTQEKVSSAVLFPTPQKQKRSRSPLALPPVTKPQPDGIFDLTNPDNYNSMQGEGKKEEEKEEEEEDIKPIVLSPEVQKLKDMLLTAPKKPITPVLTSPKNQPTKPLPRPPRGHLLHAPVFQVINANTVKDRYLFLFNDLLLICKPIMDENIIVSTSNRNSVEKNRYRFRPNENSLFQVKNIVQLGQLTLYISKDDYHPVNKDVTSIKIGPDGRPILPPARKIHPILASALRRFESNANLGIQYLIDKGVLTNDPLSIANFLFKTPDLNRRQLGYYLSDLKNSDVYDAFLECFRLVGLRLDEALRILLTTFRLPSSWEALEYLIERFAKKWHDANQNVIQFHEDMVVKVIVAMLFLNAERWYDATSERDVFWYARELKERQDRQAKRKMSVVDYQRPNISAIPQSKPSSSATTDNSSSHNAHRQSVAIEPLHYIMSLRAHGSHQPNLSEFLERWNYYDQYKLVPREFMEEMYKSIMEERLETGWDNKTGRRVHPSAEEDSNGVARPKTVTPSVNQGSQDTVITVIPHKLPTRLTKGFASDPITISIPTPDKGLQIKLRGQDLVFEPNILDFSNDCIQTFTITGNTLGRTSLMFIKTGENAGNYVSPTLPRTKSVVVERPFMRFTFQIGFKHVDHDISKFNDNRKESEDNRATTTTTTTSTNVNTTTTVKVKKLKPRKRDIGHGKEDGGVDNDGYAEEEERKHHIVNRKYTFSVETEEERIEWIEALMKLSGHVNEEENEQSIAQLNNMTIESRVALQVLKEVLLADEVKKGTARSTTTSSLSNGSGNNNKPSIVVSSISGLTNQASLPSNSSIADGTTSPMESYDERHGRTMQLLMPHKIDEDRSAIVTTTTTSTTANVVTKRGHEIVKLVVQNSMVPLVLGFLRSQIS